MESKKPASPIKIFSAFFRLGLTAFGGPAMVAYIRRLVVLDKKLVTEDSFKKGIALCQTIPGATAMQAAAYAGLRAGGPWGAVAAYVAFGRRYLKMKQDVFLVTGSAIFLGLGGNPIIAILSCGVLGLLLYRRLYLEGEQTVSAAKSTTSWELLRPALFLLLLTGIFLSLLFVIRPDLFTLAILMLKIDFFAFGGGYASVPLLFHEIVEVHHWLSNQALIDGIALGQVTPGPIVITATFVGYLLAGFPGALVGTISIFTPSLFLLLLIVPYFDRLQHSPFLQRALRGVLISFVGLLLAVTIRFGLAVHWTPLSMLISGCAFVALWQKVNILWVVLIGAVISAMLL